MSESRSQRDRMLAGELYLASDPEIQRENRRARELAERFNSTSVTEPEEQQRLLKDLLGSLGDEVEIRAPLYCDYGYQIHIGEGTFVNFGLVALDVARITIGSDVSIAPYVQLLTATHPLEPDTRRAKYESSKPISIADNVWLGGGAIICPGVSVGANTVIGAGAVVVQDVPANVVAVGNPARVVREL